MVYFYKWAGTKRSFFDRNIEDIKKIVFCKTDKIIDFHDKVLIDGKKYTICSGTRIGDDFYYSVEEISLKDDDDIQDEYESEIKCPVCGHELSDSIEMPDREEEHECEYCGSIFAYEREVSVEYIFSIVKKNTSFIEIENAENAR